MNRLTKQIIYGVIFIAMVAGAVLLAGYAIKKMSAPDIIPPIVNNKDSIQIKSFQEIPSENGKTSDYAVELYNPSEDYGVLKAKYSFSKTKGEIYILPLEKKYEIILKEEKKLSEENFKIGETVWVEISKEKSAGLAAQNKRYESFDQSVGGSSVSAVILNKSENDYKKVDINILLFDLDSNLAAVSYTKIDDLLSEQERSFKIFWPFQISKGMGNILIQASSNIMDPDNTKIFSEGSGLPY